MKKEVDELLSELISDNYLNEERFAIQFAGGKFRIKQWGRIKIKYALKQKQVSEYCIKKALKAIDEKDYTKTAEKLFEQKLKTLKALTEFIYQGAYDFSNGYARVMLNDKVGVVDKTGKLILPAEYKSLGSIYKNTILGIKPAETVFFNLK